MNCTKCKAEWSPPKDRTITKCPFCAEPLFGFSGAGKNTAPHEMLLRIVQQYNKSILAENRLKGLIADLMPNMEKKYLRITKQAVDDGIGAKLLDLEGKDLAVRIASIATIKANFKNNNAFTDTADYIIDCFLYALGWLEKPPKEKANQILIDNLTIFNEQLELAFSDGLLTKDESKSLFALAKSLSISEKDAADLIQQKIKAFNFIPDKPPDKSIKSAKEIIGSRIWKVDDKFESIKIGSQIWMKRNLDISHFRNGDLIPEVKTKEEWQKFGFAKKPTWCYYNNDPELGKNYGKLYNWWSVNDPRGLSPEGWHIPSIDEWTKLIDYLVSLGYTNERNDPNGIGNALKFSCKEYNPLFVNSNRNKQPFWSFHTNHRGIDSFGFSGLPGGCRERISDFYGIDETAFWWTRTEWGPAYREQVYAEHFVMEFDSGKLFTTCSLKISAFSVRCLRD